MHICASKACNSLVLHSSSVRVALHSRCVLCRRVSIFFGFKWVCSQSAARMGLWAGAAAIGVLLAAVWEPRLANYGPAAIKLLYAFDEQGRDHDGPSDDGGPPPTRVANTCPPCVCQLSAAPARVEIAPLLAAAFFLGAAVVLGYALAWFARQPVVVGRPTAACPTCLARGSSPPTSETQPGSRSEPQSDRSSGSGALAHLAVDAGYFNDEVYRPRRK